MKYITLFITILLWANNQYEIELYEKLFQKLFNKKIITIYISEKESLDLSNSKILKIVDSCEKADIELVFQLPHICKNKPYFILNSYPLFLHSEAIGVFYWRKSRPQLKLRKKIIFYFKLDINNSLRKYIE